MKAIGLSGLTPILTSLTERPKHMALPRDHIWIFVGAHGRSPGGAFNSIDLAEAWIKKHGLSGTLTAYPIDQGCFDWAVEHGLTGMKPETLEGKRSDPSFIGSFTTAGQEHHHYEKGERG